MSTCRIAVHPLKADKFINLTVYGIETHSNSLQFANALLGIFLSKHGSSIVFNPVSIKQAIPSSSKVGGKMISFKFSHELKALSPILFKLLGKNIFLRL